MLKEFKKFIMRGNVIDMAAVSYTHLDVFKRQFVERFSEPGKVRARRKYRLTENHSGAAGPSQRG